VSTLPGLGPSSTMIYDYEKNGKKYTERVDIYDRRYA